MPAILCEPTRRTYLRPLPGDLVVINAANDKVNAYRVCPDFSFADVVGMVTRGEIGIVLDFASSENGSVLYHYVKVLFSSGFVGIVHYGLLQKIQTPDNAEDFIETTEER